MRQSKRVLFFILGVGLGCFIAFGLFGGRDVTFNYLPNARVVNYLTQYPLKYQPKAECQKSCYDLDSMAIVQLIRNGSVDFDKSNPRPDSGICKSYFIEGEMYGKQASVIVETCDTIGVIKEFDYPSDVYCDCD